MPLQYIYLVILIRTSSCGAIRFGLLIVCIEIVLPEMRWKRE